MVENVTQQKVNVSVSSRRFNSLTVLHSYIKTVSGKWFPSPRGDSIRLLCSCARIILFLMLFPSPRGDSIRLPSFLFPPLIFKKCVSVSSRRFNSLTLLRCRPFVQSPSTCFRLLAEIQFAYDKRRKTKMRLLSVFPSPRGDSIRLPFLWQSQYTSALIVSFAWQKKISHKFTSLLSSKVPRTRVAYGAWQIRPTPWQSHTSQSATFCPHTECT